MKKYEVYSKTYGKYQIYDNVNRAWVMINNRPVVMSGYEVKQWMMDHNIGPDDYAWR